jgi:putative acyl-CoA dehydrogenase
MRLAHAVDDGDSAFLRLAVAAAKFWVCKRTPPMVAEALECLGGNGYVEENGLARLYREAPLNSIWEGSGNVAALDVLRALMRDPEGLPAFLAECQEASGADARLDQHIADLEADIAAFDPEEAQWRARALVERLALALQASLLVRYTPPAVADAFCAGRLGGGGGRAFGTLPTGVDAPAILDRALAA